MANKFSVMDWYCMVISTYVSLLHGYMRKTIINVVCVYVYMYLCMCVYVYMYVRMYACTYVCVYTHTHAHIYIPVCFFTTVLISF